MADITDPYAIRFVNEQIRPLAEACRDLKIRIEAAADQWVSGGVQTIVGSSALDNLIDGRSAEGVRQLTAEEINTIAVAINSVAAAINDADMAKAAVRPVGL